MNWSFSIDNWTLKQPFVTSQDRMHAVETLTVYLNDGGYTGRGEALGVDYLGETPQSMSHQLLGISKLISDGLKREHLRTILPPGGARNALDCAIWDLESKQQGQRAWAIAAVDMHEVTSVYTLALDEPDAMAREALTHAEMPALKLKLDEKAPLEQLTAIRAARPDAELVIDANGAWTPELLDQVADGLASAGVAMLEQPLPRGSDQSLKGAAYPVPLCGDESCQHLGELEAAAERYDMINIKLDKCGGLTEALQMVRWCQARDLSLMVGNMLGSSLAMAPALLVAQHCRHVDLDGPLWQVADRDHPLSFENGRVSLPDRELWG